MNVPLESEIQRACISYLKLKGHLVVRFNNIPMEKDGRKIPVRQRGVSDLLVCEKGTGKFIAIEVKRPGGKPTDEQQEFLLQVRSKGGIAFIAESIDDLQKHAL